MLIIKHDAFYVYIILFITHFYILKAIATPTPDLLHLVIYVLTILSKCYDIIFHLSTTIN